MKNCEIYLDNSSTTKPIPKAVEACNFALTQEYGNSSSLHRKGFLAENLMSAARVSIANALSCLESEIIFTSGATESNNLAIIGAAQALSRRGKKIVTTAIEHASVRLAVNFLESQGFIVEELIPNADGYYTTEQFIEAVDDNTILVSCMYVNNETGLILPVKAIANAVKKKNPKTIMHVDAVQAFMKFPIKLSQTAIDLMSFSGHKIGAIKGIGGLFVKKGVRLVPQTYGGNQENGLRCGTQSVPLISAFGAAVAEISPKIDEYLKYYYMLNKHLVDRLFEIPEIKINSSIDEKLNAPYIINISTGVIRSEVMLHFLEQFEIYVSSGSACSKGKQSYVLSALSLDKSRSDTALRISFSPDTTIEQLDILADKLNEGIGSLAHS
ncbi:MAG: cysteine desulfurase family protein [Oscillospiraceae bacterium]